MLFNTSLVIWGCKLGEVAIKGYRRSEQLRQLKCMKLKHCKGSVSHFFNNHGTLSYDLIYR